ncbi:MAG: hypothetical protein GX446_09140 [Chthonomonadales bacterium]|nr:hypothetical protein [Chthonomonadales bacterium]
MHSYPLSLSFKMIAISPQVRVADSTGRLIMYVRQKAFKLREDVTVYSDEQQRFELLRIKADRIIDVSATYTIRDRSDQVVGAVRGQGIRSLWRRSFAILDSAGQEIGSIVEDNPWVKVVDGVVGELPLVGWIAAMFINPAYTVTFRGAPTLHLVKKPSFLERHFEVQRLADVTESDEQLLLASLLMMLLLVRGTG